MTSSRDLPGLNYAVITGVVKRRKGINMTLNGIPVLHLLVENTVTPFGDGMEITLAEIEVDVWGKLATSIDTRVHQGDAVLVEGRLAHRKTKDRAGGEHYKTLLRARRIEIVGKSKERKG